MQDQIIQLLDSANLEYKVASKSISIRCPFSSQSDLHKGLDRTPSMVLWPKIAWVKCYTCGYTSPIDRFFSNFCDVSNLCLDIDFLPFSAKPDKETRDNPVVSERVLKHFSDFDIPIRNYLANRKIDLSLMPCKLYWNSNYESVMMPVRNGDGELVGITSRSTKEGQKSHHYLGMLTTKSLLGNEICNHNKKIIVEGMTDVLNTYQNLALSGLKYDVYGTMTAKLSDWHRDRLLEMDCPLFVAYDPDKAGRRGAADAIQKLETQMPTNVEWDNLDIDMGNMPLSMFKDLFG